MRLLWTGGLWEGGWLTGLFPWHHITYSLPAHNSSMWEIASLMLGAYRGPRYFAQLVIFSHRFNFVLVPKYPSRLHLVDLRYQSTVKALYSTAAEHLEWSLIWSLMAMSNYRNSQVLLHSSFLDVESKGLLWADSFSSSRGWDWHEVDIYYNI